MPVICQFCNTEYDEEAKVCSNCGAANLMYEEQIDENAEADGEMDVLAEPVPSAPPVDPLLGHVDLDDEIEQKSLVPVFRAPTELVANIIKGLLESESIPVTISSRQIPWMDGVMTMGEGFYGDLLVPESEESKARQVIEAYQPPSKQA